MHFYRPNLMNDNIAAMERERIIERADISLGVKPLHITDAPAQMSPGGPHDYYSNGDYWWPNPDTTDGLPYINRDGQTNPANFDGHRLLLRNLRTHVANLAAAYSVTHTETYAQKAVTLLKEFFLDEPTKMNPHLLYAQAIPGICTGRGIGVIDTLHLIDIPPAIEALKSSAALLPVIYTNLKRWFADYLYWMTNHPYGIAEMNAQNNHAVCWFVQASVFASFTDNQELMELCRDRYKNILLPNQMASDGSFPLELRRTKPYSYSIFVLDNMVTLCYVLSKPDDNLWDYTLNDGRGIQKGIEFLYPYLVDKSQWPYPPDVQHFAEWPVRFSALLFGGICLPDPKLLDLWQTLNPEPRDMEVRRNIAIRQPILWLA